VSIDRLDTFTIVRQTVASHLGIEPEIVDRSFRFHHFIDVLAAIRQKKANAKSSSDYIEAVNIYIDLSEKLDVDFFTEFTGNDCLTIGDLVDSIQAKLDDK
jgi:hypothetical protein